jgi:hypothetical protein
MPWNINDYRQALAKTRGRASGGGQADAPIAPTARDGQSALSLVPGLHGGGHTALPIFAKYPL